MKNKASILLVEDNEGDIVLINEAFEEASASNELIVLKDGYDAIRFLKKEEDYQEVVTPDLILLDLNLPRINGIELLKRIKNDLVLKTIPVIIFTTSNAEKDILQAYENHANWYVRKPANFSDLITLVQKMINFWIDNVELPKRKL